MQLGERRFHRPPPHGPLRRIENFLPGKAPQYFILKNICKLDIGIPPLNTDLVSLAGIIMTFLDLQGAIKMENSERKLTCVESPLLGAPSNPEEQSQRLDPGVGPQNTVVVIPTFNERGNMEKLVKTLLGAYPEIRILVADDHSPDGTADVVRELQPRFRNLMLLERMQNPGYGPSLRDAFRKALAEPRCQAIVTMDADFSHDPTEVGHLLEKLADHNVVVGSRYTSEGGIGRWSLRRRILSRGANLYVRTILRLGIHDVTSGFLCMRREALKRVPIEQCQSNGYAFLVELKYLLERDGNRMAEHPIFFNERSEGKSKMSTRKIWESIWLPWRIRLRYRSLRG